MTHFVVFVFCERTTTSFFIFLFFLLPFNAFVTFFRLVLPGFLLAQVFRREHGVLEAAPHLQKHPPGEEPGARQVQERRRMEEGAPAQHIPGVVSGTGDTSFLVSWVFWCLFVCFLFIWTIFSRRCNYSVRSNFFFEKTIVGKLRVMLRSRYPQDTWCTCGTYQVSSTRYFLVIFCYGSLASVFFRCFHFNFIFYP